MILLTSNSNELSSQEMLNRIGSEYVQIQSHLPTGNPEVSGNKGASRGGEDGIVPLEHGRESSNGGTSSWQS